ncbi:ribonuclease activity regulator RraA [Shumkonia mesophila]|uniref:ribonuclease activity regulator RraA n=1 Tax=Shumkonia mesophila TaxID=2838854 RepID=UPI0029343733|nr:ribonuclease activity regulator RraA [Shumkonia mesophila]
MDNSQTIEKLYGITTATIIAALMKRGIRRAVMKGVMPMVPSTQKCVGPAFTMRNIPIREDKGGAEKLGDPKYPQRVMLETAPAGSIVVMDCMGEPGSAMAGDLMAARLKVRGIAGLVGDGGMRDVTETATIGFPIYCKGPTPYPSTNAFLAHELQCPIACGTVAVYPGDIIVADGDGVVVIPAHLAAEIATESERQEKVEAFCKEKLLEGRPMPGTYPPSEATMREFEEWLKAGH